MLPLHNGDLISVLNRTAVTVAPASWFYVTYLAEITSSIPDLNRGFHLGKVTCCRYTNRALGDCPAPPFPLREQGLVRLWAALPLLVSLQGALSKTCQGPTTLMLLAGTHMSGSKALRASENGGSRTRATCLEDRDAAVTSHSRGDLSELNRHYHDHNVEHYRYAKATVAEEGIEPSTSVLSGPHSYH